MAHRAERDGEFAGYFGSCIDINDLGKPGNTRALIDELNHRGGKYALDRQAWQGNRSRRQRSRLALAAFGIELAAHRMLSDGTGIYIAR
jgi:hypothetical protein